MTDRSVPTVPLLHGADIPVLGVGTWPLDDDGAHRSVAAALEAGYRMIDTAAGYGNEVGVGRAVAESGLERKDLFVTSKFSKDHHGRDLAVTTFEQSTERLGLDYLDLLLIHWPNPGLDRYVQAWEGLVDLLESGRIRAAGVSNFKPAHLERIIAATSVVPDVNQIQLSPVLIQSGARAFHAEHGIVTQSYSPLGGDGADVLNDSTVQAIAADTGRTAAQVVLRWHVQCGLVAIPKSANPQRLRANLDVVDFELTAQQMAALTALDRGDHTGIDSDAVGW